MAHPPWCATAVVCGNTGKGRNPAQTLSGIVESDSLRADADSDGRRCTLLDGETPYIFNVRLFGAGGTIQNNEVFSRPRYPGSLDYWKFPTIEPDSGDVSHHPFVPEIAHFIECIENDVESHASIHDTWKSMAVCFAIDASAAQGGAPVRMEDIAHV